MAAESIYRISLTGMDFHAFHGHYDLEQQTGSHFLVGLEIDTRLGSVIEDDEVESTVNYLTVYEIVRCVMQRKQRTIERVALNIIEALEERFPQIVQVECRVEKLAPPLGGKCRSAAVVLRGVRRE